LKFYGALVDRGATVERQRAEAWVTAFFASWENGDANAAAALFTEDAQYASHPFAEPLLGRAAIAAYWSAGVARQSDIDIHVGRPVIDGERVAVEWWVSLAEDGEDSLSTGTLVLRFDGELCASLREVWMERPGRALPPEGWGS
jgi:ketosteroid isomerase-like protein